MILKLRHYPVYYILFFSLLFLFSADMTASVGQPDSLRTNVGDSLVRKSIYPPSATRKSNLYNRLWGEHYRSLYSVPITVPSVTLQTLWGGLKVVEQVADFQGLLLENNRQQLCLLKPLGGYTTFIESEFFQEVYNKKVFKNTYLDQFIGDAYTIINPYTFISSDYLARSTGLSSNNSRIFYLPTHSTRDTVADGTPIENKLVSVIDVPDFNTRPNILLTEDLLDTLQVNNSYRVNQEFYIRERLFDMLIGDWNKIPENWNWMAHSGGDSLVFDPIVIDRNHAFTKVDGILFKQMLHVLGLGFIVNYDASLKSVRKENTLGFSLDMALASQSDVSVWIDQARFIQRTLTDSVIGEAFSLLPKGVEGHEIERISRIVKDRRDKLEEIATAYFVQLQRTPVITGSDRSERFVIDRHNPDSLFVQIYDKETGRCVFDRKFSRKKTKEVWLYGLEGDDRFEVSGEARKEIPIFFIAGKGENSYQLASGHHIRIYEYKSKKEALDTVPYAKKIFSDLPEIHRYDYTKIKHHKIAFTPWGIYDSDKGFSLGTYFTYTMYGFKRSPFTYQHRIGYNYLQGFMYQGIFPSYDGRKIFTIDATISSRRDFYNFFGFGNNTDGYKDAKKNYNRVHIRQFRLSPSFNLNFNEKESLTVQASVEMFKARKTSDRFINQYYPENHRIFETSLFFDLGATIQTEKELASFISRVAGALTAGWKMNLKDAGRNFPYAKASVAMDVRITDRLTWATMAKTQLLFNNKYEFYQAATTELRGYRDNRFIGKQSFFQYSDIRLDMGKLKNPFTPLKYGVFAGFDYGRVWFPGEESKRWHTSYGGGVWLTLINKITTKYSWFGSTDSFRFMFELGLGF